MAYTAALIMLCRTGLRYTKRLETVFLVLKMGLTGIAAWSAHASDRARSIGFSKPILRPTKLKFNAKVKKLELWTAFRHALLFESIQMGP